MKIWAWGGNFERMEVSLCWSRALWINTNCPKYILYLSSENWSRSLSSTYFPIVIHQNRGLKTDFWLRFIFFFIKGHTGPFYIKLGTVPQFLYIFFGLKPKKDHKGLFQLLGPHPSNLKLGLKPRFLLMPTGINNQILINDQILTEGRKCRPSFRKIHFWPKTRNE